MFHLRCLKGFWIGFFSEDHFFVYIPLLIQLSYNTKVFYSRIQKHFLLSTSYSKDSKFLASVLWKDL